ncbi:hypothetical protein [Crocosphaera sp.]|uniref:hypothetical protein n=1 Tax=Crocosphaera sp. TaxID=2729996 RepID=UPI00262C9A79|nr:hypothetical protein [Crocosphaera sp.]MDJ0582122.1 hypothetical protein [Crocosphaera sp.]
MIDFSYRRTVETIITMLRECRYIAIDEASIGDELGDELLSIIEQEFGIQLGDSLKSLYNEMGNVDIRWHVNLDQYSDLQLLHEEDSYISGSIQFLDPYTMFSGRDGTFWENTLWFDDIEGEINDRLRNFKPIDFQNSENIIGVFLENGILVDSLTLYSSSNGLTNLPFGIDEYFSLLEETLGYVYWPIALMQPYSEEREKLVHYIGQLFPEKTLNHFR